MLMDAINPPRIFQFVDFIKLELRIKSPDFFARIGAVGFFGHKQNLTLSRIRCMTTQVGTITEQLLSRKAVAARWQTSVETVKRREKQGLLNPIRFNQRLLRYKLSDILQIEAEAGGAK
jgi:hypothetical protein